MMLLSLNPIPQDDHLKIAAFGGTMSGFMASIQWQNIVSTVVLTVIGALVSFGMSLFLQRYVHFKS
ncbi:hypothetical protein [Faecalibacter rhinopitheci]|uniref:Uncharacterized protein n=1 Tax=Faecalibacter rhinopitheci TaxID=2779678 RepID=A0A8J7FR13_9FLAO|nr:hypothetical protein [Faecalibacter rhinopitheci]MBF0596818.1 hypothetical protein [Faecalibacter rhinopitheci]